MNALIVCHAGEGIGLGHLSRVLVIAQALQLQFDADVRLLIVGAPFVRDDLNAYEHAFIALNDAPLFEQAVLASDAVDLVIFDLYPRGVPATLEQVCIRLRNRGAKLIAIDGLLEWRPLLDLIFLPAFHFSRCEPLQEGAPIVFGWDCFLLPEQVTPAAWTPGPRVLVLTGGSDATGLGKTWPALLAQTLPQGTELHWVRGPFAAPPSWPITSRIRMIEHQSPVGLTRLMQQANWAVTVFGVSFFELLHLGVPCVVFSPYQGKDDVDLELIASKGVALVAHNEQEATGLLRDLMQDIDLAARMAKRARATLNVSGARRFCEEVARLMA